MSAITTSFDLDAWSSVRLHQVEQALSRWVTADVPQGLSHGAPAQLVEAMRYSVLDGGKRLRPLLVLPRTRPCAWAMVPPRAKPPCAPPVPWS